MSKNVTEFAKVLTMYLPIIVWPLLAAWLIAPKPNPFLWFAWFFIIVQFCSLVYFVWSRQKGN